MATQPTNDLLVWANTDVNLPNLAGPNKTEPSADLVAKGWDFKQKPSADEFNYILNNLGEWIEYLKTVVIEATPEATANTLALRDSNGSFKVKQLTSTAPDGTEPLLVSSRTKVDNLNADLLDGFSTSQTATANTVVVRDSSAKVVSDLTGNADTASKWQTPRTLNVSGAVTGSVSIDGSGNIPLTLYVGSGVQRYITKTVALSTTIRNGSVTVSLPTTLFGGNTPSFVTFSATAYSNTVADLYGYGLNAGISQNQATMLMACGSDDTDQGTGIIMAASSFVLPYKASQDFYIYADGGYSFTCTTTIYVTGYQI